MHARYFLEHVEIIRQVLVAKELTDMTEKQGQLDEGGQRSGSNGLDNMLGQV
jgi:hypothetical protein